MSLIGSHIWGLDSQLVVLLWWMLWKLCEVQSCCSRGITGGSLSELIYSHLPLPVFSLCFVFAVEDAISELPAPTSMPAACYQASPAVMDSSPLEQEAQRSSFFSELLLVTALYHSNRNGTHMPFVPVTAEFSNILLKPVLSNFF